MQPTGPEGRRNDDPGTPLARTTCAGRPRRIQWFGTAHPRGPRRLRLGTHVLAAAAPRPDRPDRDAVRRRRARRDDAGAFPEDDTERQPLSAPAPRRTGGGGGSPRGL